MSDTTETTKHQWWTISNGVYLIPEYAAATRKRAIEKFNESMITNNKLSNFPHLRPVKIIVSRKS